MQRVNLSYKLDAYDPHGVRIMETIAADIEETLAPEDKNWKPSVHHEIVIPPLAESGTYKIAVSVTDVIGNATATAEVPFEVHGRRVDASDTLVIRSMRFYRGEDEREAIAQPAYRRGDAVWARFDIVGYKFGDGNGIDVSYDVAVLAPTGKVLFTQPAGRRRPQPVILSQTLCAGHFQPGDQSGYPSRQLHPAAHRARWRWQTNR